MTPSPIPADPQPLTGEELVEIASRLADRRTLFGTFDVMELPEILQRLHATISAARARIAELEAQLDRANKMITNIYTQTEVDKEVQDAINEYRSDMR